MERVLLLALSAFFSCLRTLSFFVWNILPLFFERPYEICVDPYR